MEVTQGGSEVLSFGPRGKTRALATTREGYSVLFLCERNSITSILAEAILRNRGGKDFKSFSAGTRPDGEVNPLAREVLKTSGMWHDGLRSKSSDQFLAPDAPRMDYVITLGQRPPAGLPHAWPGSPQVIHWRIADPKIDRKPIENERSLRKALGELETRIKLFVLVHQRKERKVAAAA